MHQCSHGRWLQGAGKGPMTSHEPTADSCHPGVWVWNSVMVWILTWLIPQSSLSTSRQWHQEQQSYRKQHLQSWWRADCTHPLALWLFICPSLMHLWASSCNQSQYCSQDWVVLPIIFIDLLVKPVIYSQTSHEHKKGVKHSQLLTAEVNCAISKISYFCCSLLSLRSLINILNIPGPDADPWSILLLTSFHGENWALIPLLFFLPLI